MSVPSEDMQFMLDSIARSIATDSCTLGGSVIEWEWGNCKIECFYSPLRDYLIKMAQDYTRLRKITNLMPPEQLARYQKKLETK
jgi:hypothetical protein